MQPVRDEIDRMERSPPDLSVRMVPMDNWNQSDQNLKILKSLHLHDEADQKDREEVYESAEPSMAARHTTDTHKQKGTQSLQSSLRHAIEADDSPETDGMKSGFFTPSDHLAQPDADHFDGNDDAKDTDQLNEIAGYRTAAAWKDLTADDTASSASLDAILGKAGKSTQKHLDAQDSKTGRFALDDFSLYEKNEPSGRSGQADHKEHTDQGKLTDHNPSNDAEAGSQADEKTGKMDSESISRELDEAEKEISTARMKELFGEDALSDAEKAESKKEYTFKNPKLKTTRKKKPHRPNAIVRWWRAKKQFGFGMSLFLTALMIFLIMAIWSLFVAGPYKVHEEKLVAIYAKIQQEVPNIRGLEQVDFDYVTYQGYTDDTLYWFDVTGALITTRPINTLNYQAAKDKALAQYNVETDTIQLAYGYTSPVYEIQGSNTFLLLDYDSLELIYQRNEVPVRG